MTSTMMSIRLGRPPSGVEADLGALVAWGFVEQQADGSVLAPFDVIHADFDISAAA